MRLRQSKKAPSFLGAFFACYCFLGRYEAAAYVPDYLYSGAIIHELKLLAHRRARLVRAGIVFFRSVGASAFPGTKSYQTSVFLKRVSASMNGDSPVLFFGCRLNYALEGVRLVDGQLAQYFAVEPDSGFIQVFNKP